MPLYVASSGNPVLVDSGKDMKLSRLTSNLLLACGIITLFSLTTRAYTWYVNDLQADPYLAWLHFPIIGIFLLIGAYLAYLGVRGRRATRRQES